MNTAVTTLQGTMYSCLRACWDIQIPSALPPPSQRWTVPALTTPSPHLSSEASPRGLITAAGASPPLTECCQFPKLAKVVPLPPGPGHAYWGPDVVRQTGPGTVLLLTASGSPAQLLLLIS